MCFPTPSSSDPGFEQIGSRSAAPAVGPGIPSEDWDCLFEAVVARLRATTTPGRSGAAATAQPQDPVRRIQTTVSECVVALNRLHAMQPRECASRAAL